MLVNRPAPAASSGLLTESEQDGLRKQQKHDQRALTETASPRSPCGPRSDAGAIPGVCSENVGDHRSNCSHGPAADQPGEEEHRVAERGRRKRRLAEAPQHDHVGRQDCHLGKLGQHQGAASFDSSRASANHASEPVTRYRAAGMGKIKFSNIGHGTVLSFRPAPGLPVSDEKQKNPPKRFPGSGGEIFERGAETRPRSPREPLRRRRRPQVERRRQHANLAIAGLH